MQDQRKSKRQLIAEQDDLRRQVAAQEAGQLDRQRVEQALRERELHYSSLIAALSEGVVFQDATGRIQACNPSAERILGLTEQQMLGRTSQDPRWCAIHEDGSPFPGDSHPAMVTLRTGKPLLGVVMGIHQPHGGVTWISVNSQPLFTPDAAAPYAVVTTFQDITDRKQAEAALRASEEKYRGIAERSRDVIFLVDAAGIITYISPAVRRLLGYAPEEVVGCHFQKVVVEEAFSAARDAFYHVLNGQDHAIETRYKRKDGTSVVATVDATPIWVEGRIAGIQGIVYNLTEQREAEDRLHLMLAASKAGWWHWDLVENRVTADAQAKAFFGIPPDAEVSFQTFLDRLAPGEAPAVRGAFPPVLPETGEDFDAEFHLLWPDGSHHWVLGRGRAFRDAAGQPKRLMGLVTDITQLKEAEAERQRQREELAHVTRLATMGELAVSLAHELNQPLAAIQHNAEAAEMFLAQVPPPLDDIHAILVDIRKDNWRAAEVIRRMRSLLQKRPFQPELLRIEELLADAVSLVANRARMEKIAIRTQCGDGLPLVRGDRVQLQQVLLNLALNGMDALGDSPQPERVLLFDAHVNQQGYVDVLVVDRGTGISSAQLSRLFAPFYTTKSHGMGLGMSIAQTIVEAHGGQIWAKNNPDRGATVGFSLPAAGKSV